MEFSQQLQRRDDMRTGTDEAERKIAQPSK